MTNLTHRMMVVYSPEFIQYSSLFGGGEFGGGKGTLNQDVDISATLRNIELGHLPEAIFA